MAVVGLISDLYVQERGGEQPHMGHEFSQYYEGSWSMTVFHEEAEVADLGVPCSGGECSDFFYNCLLWQLLWGWQDGAAEICPKGHQQQFPFSGARLY